MTSSRPISPAVRMVAQFPLALLSAAILLPLAAAQMPYNPTRILRHGNTLYVFQPAGGSSQFQLGSIDIASSIATSSVPYTTLYPSLPFLNAQIEQPFTPVLDNGGNITVYTGNCSQGANGAELWNFTPQPSDTTGNGTWQKQDISYDQNGKHASVIGANYLNAGMAFSSVVGDDMSETSAFFFGGMCPYSEDQQTWQSSANYSNLMATLDSPGHESQKLTYKLGTSSSRGPPIPEAGFTLTGLQPSYSNHSDGSQTQQQDYVLIGGHTSAAFINMSQVAVFSLPQQGWTFVPVSQPNTQRTDISIQKDITDVDPRSGHTAVLAPNGQQIVVFGGWVGDTSTPADPQLAVLNVDESGDWEWTVPTTSGSGSPSSSGIYGHGAAMLPGGVMMITGGFSISSTSSNKRRSDQTNTKAFFFNVTSNTWTTDYVPPAESESSTGSPGPLATTSQKAGLGAGLGVGMAAVFGLLVFYFWYTRRLKRQRDLREKQLEDLALGAHRYNLDCLSPGVDGRGGQVDAGEYLDDVTGSYFYPAAGVGRAKGWRQTSGHDAERTGLLVEIPSPTRGLRRSLGGRPAHQTARYDDRRVRGSGHIHPIDELDEDAEHDNNVATDKTPLTSDPEMRENPKMQQTSIFANVPALDPFITTQEREYRASQIRPAPPSPEHWETHHEHEEWFPAAEVLMPRQSSPHSNGRTSPDKSERTASNLSERSQRSDLSGHSARGSLARTASMRSAVLTGLALNNPFKSPDASPTSPKANKNSEDWESAVDPRTKSLTSVRSYRPTTAEERESFSTARTSFMQLQVEGEALLGGNPDRGRPNTGSSSSGSRGYADTDPSMSRADTVTAATSVIDGAGRPRRKSWLGSVRRALARASTTSDARTRSLTTSMPQLERYTDNPQAFVIADDKRRSLQGPAPPRRAASDASFWRSRRGRQDWLEEELDPDDPRAKWRRNSGDDWGAPEDVMLAERERRRREWRDRSNLINLMDDDLAAPLARTPRTPLSGLDVSDSSSNRPRTPLDEGDWDVEAAIERRVVQVMFTVPKSKLRVVNADADADRSSVISTPRDHADEVGAIDTTASGSSAKAPSGSPGRVKDLVGKFEQVNSSPPRISPRASPRPSPSPSITGVKLLNQEQSPSPSIRNPRIRTKDSPPSLAAKKSSASLDGAAGAKGKSRLVSEDITSMGR